MNPSFHKYQLIFSVFKGIFFSSFWKVLSVVLIFKNVEERPTPEKYRPASLLSIVHKIFEKTVKNDELFDHFEKCGVFPDFLHGFRFFLVQMQIFSQLDLTELPGLLTCLRILNLQHLIYQRVLTVFGTLFFFSK